MWVSHIPQRVQKFDKQYWYHKTQILAYSPQYGFLRAKRNTVALEMTPQTAAQLCASGAAPGVQPGRAGWDSTPVELGGMLGAIQGGIPPHSPRLSCFCTVWSKQPESYFCQVALQLISPGSQIVNVPPPLRLQNIFQSRLQTQSPKLLDKISWWGDLELRVFLKVHDMSGLGVQGQLQCFVLRWMYLLIG